MSRAGVASPSPGLIDPRGAADALAKAESAIRPQWLRPAAIAVVVALHVAVAAFVVASVVSPVPLEGVEVTLLPQGDSDQDRPKSDEVKQAEPAPAPAPLPEPTPRAPELAAPVPNVVAPEAVPLPMAKPEPREAEKRPTPDELRKQRREQAAAAEKRREREAAAEQRRKAQAAQRAERRGVAEGRGKAVGNAGMSQAAYASLLAAEVARHKVYPAAARAEHVTGSVGVVFTVGSSGRIISHSITRSSGNSSLDGAVHAMMAAVHAPPPPGGTFRSSTTINFNLR